MTNVLIDRELLPCPFCGNSDFLIEQLDGCSSVVICQGMVSEYSCCLARGPVAIQDDDGEDQPGRDAAVREWNARAILAKPAPEVEAVEVVAYCAFADNGNIRMWGRSTEGACNLIDSAGNKAVPLITLAAHNAEVARLRGEVERLNRARDNQFETLCKMSLELERANALLASCRGIVAREVDRWNRVAASLLDKGAVESSLLKQIDAHLSQHDRIIAQLTGTK